MTENHELLERIDHTLLTPTADWESVRTLCLEAERWGTASVCIPPSYVARVHDAFPQLNICTVVGFPNGYSTTAVKIFEAKTAVGQGAQEIDMVVNLGDVKNGSFDAVREELFAVREATRGVILKIIIETCYLTEAEIIRLCELVTEADADFIKTSTGFGPGGAKPEDIRLFFEHVGVGVRVKAAGGMKTLSEIEAFAELGCHRLGTSRAIRLLREAGRLED